MSGGGYLQGGVVLSDAGLVLSHLMAHLFSSYAGVALSPFYEICDGLCGGSKYPPPLKYI